MNRKTWRLLPVDKQKCTTLYNTLKIRKIYCNLLINRGIDTFEQAHTFFRPHLKMLHNPGKMKGMQKTVSRIEEATKKNEKILIYGDYDVDGTTAVATVFSFLQNYLSLRGKENNIHYYIPDRYKEGYGISRKGIDFAKTNHFNLIIALDCGIKALEQITYAHASGIDVVVCDHHLPEKELPPAYSILNPKQPGCGYPYKELSGCGIGFKLIAALAAYWGLPDQAYLQYLDLVATSIAADIVPMTGENRILTYFGLKKLNEDPLPALKALSEVSRIRKKILIGDLVFMIAPRINAAGRMEDARKAVDLFIEKDLEKAILLAEELHQLNGKRKELDNAITQDILKEIENNSELIQRKTTVLFNPDWHKGVIGIVASRVMETYYRPTIILTQSQSSHLPDKADPSDQSQGEQVTGSARSVKGFNIYQALKSCSPLLEQFGGHFFAAGMSLKPSNVEAFIRKFEEVVAKSIDPELLTPTIDIDAEITLRDIDERFYKMLLQFEPFGPENRRPVFIVRGLMDNGYSKLLRSRHIRFEVYHPSCREHSFVGIGFNLADKFDFVTSGKPFDLCFSLTQNDFSGQSQLQLEVKDIRPAVD